MRKRPTANGSVRQVRRCESGGKRHHQLQEARRLVGVRSTRLLSNKGALSTTSQRGALPLLKLLHAKLEARPWIGAHYPPTQ